MAQRSRNILKQYFETGDKPTREQFADLIDSLFNLTDDGGARVKQLLEVLVNDNRLKKSAVRGADFALNRRGKGNIMGGTFQLAMVDILPGDFWIYNIINPPPPDSGDAIVVGDWVIALRSNLTPSFNYQNDSDWQIVHFGDTTVNQQSIELKHLRMSPTVAGDIITMTGINAQIINITINKLTYYGKLDDGEFGNNDFVYREGEVVGNTEIQINEELLDFRFMPGMVIDIMYKLNN